MTYSKKHENRCKINTKILCKYNFIHYKHMSLVNNYMISSLDCLYNTSKISLNIIC